jgi:hypothetical protein
MLLTGGRLPGETYRRHLVKKKTEKRKLVLAKETVAKLESGDLRHVAGGTLADTACYGCFSGNNTCNCGGSRNTCGTRLC